MSDTEAMKKWLEALENSVDLVSNEAREAEVLYGKYPSRLLRVQGLVALEVAHQEAIKSLSQAISEAEGRNIAEAEQASMTNAWFKKCCELQDELKALQEQEGHGLTIAYMSGFQDGKRARKPLTEMQIIEATEHIDESIDGYYIRIARAIESAHGIKEKT